MNAKERAVAEKLRKQRERAYWEGQMKQGFARTAKVSEERAKLGELAETLIPVKLTLTDKELKLLNLALNSGSPQNEWQTALIKLGESLRKRTNEFVNNEFVFTREAA